MQLSLLPVTAFVKLANDFCLLGVEKKPWALIVIHELTTLGSLLVRTVSAIIISAPFLSRSFFPSFFLSTSILFSDFSFLDVVARVNTYDQ